MNEYFTLIVEQQHTADLNALGEAMGHGPNCFSVKLSQDGSTHTHTALNTIASAGYTGLWAWGFVEPIEGYTNQEVNALRELTTERVADLEDYPDKRAHFEARLVELGLTRWSDPSVSP